MGVPAGHGIQSRGSVQSPGRNAEFRRSTCAKGREVTGTQCDARIKWFQCLRGGVREDICVLHCRYDKPSRLCRACRKLVGSATLKSTQMDRRKTLPQDDDRGSIELGDTVCSGLLKDTECEDNLSPARKKGFRNRR